MSTCARFHWALKPLTFALQMEEEGVPSTALREVSLLQMLSESIFVVRCAPVPAWPVCAGP